MSVSDHTPTRGAQIVAGLLLVNQLAAVLCQFVQGTDPRFPLLYFTVDSAIAAATVALITLVAPSTPWLQALRHSVAVGVIISAVVFMALIAPATDTGTWFQPHDDAWVRIATVLLHGVAPALVIVDYMLRTAPMRPLEAATQAFGWPLTYLVGMSVLVAVAGQDIIPYPFLSPQAMGWGTVALAIAVLIVLVACCGLALGTLGRISWARHRRSSK